MFDRIKAIINAIKKINKDVTEYKKDTVIQSLPSLAFVNKAKKLLEENKLEEAETELRKALEFPQEDSLVYKYLGVIYDKLHKFNDAVDMYQKSADINSEDKDIWQKLGFALINIKDFKNAANAFENANKINPLNSDIFTGWGIALMKLEEYSKAREKFIEAAKYNRYNFSAIFLSAVVEIKLEMYNDAEVKLKFLTSVAGNETNNYEYAHLMFLKKDYDNAIFYIKKALEYNSNIFPAYLMIGQIYALKFDKKKSLSYFKKAEDKGLIDSDLYLEWGKALLRFTDYKEARMFLMKAYDMNSTDIYVIENLLLVNVLLNELIDINLLLNLLEEKAPESSILKQAKSILAFLNGNFEIAYKDLSENCDKVDNKFINYFYMAKCAEGIEDEQKINDYYNAAIVANPYYTDAYTSYAKYLISKNKYAEAQRKLRKINKTYPENIQVLNLLFHVSYILVKENICEYNLKEAISIANKIQDKKLLEYPEELNDLVEMMNNLTEKR